MIYIHAFDVVCRKHSCAFICKHLCLNYYVCQSKIVIFMGVSTECFYYIHVLQTHEALSLKPQTYPTAYIIQLNMIMFHVQSPWLFSNSVCQTTSNHYSNVKMCAMASQITGLTIVYSTVYSGPDQRKHQTSVSLAFVRRIHR